MVKKGIIIALTVGMAACLFGGCANRSNKPTDNPMTEQSQTANSETKDNSAEMPPDAITLQQSETFNDLTKNTATGVCIDYVIESYENVQKFGYDLFAQSISEKNPVLSPVSVYLALSMAGCGADGATGDEFYHVLGNDMMSLSDDMMNTLPEDGELLKLSIANSAWIDDEFVIEDEWLGTIKSLMDAEAFQTDLSTGEVVNHMNSWISDKTNGMIDQMIEQPFDARARLVLFDTVYFKGKWQMPFEATNTHREDFFLDKAQNVTEQVDMMNLYLSYADYIANDFAEGVILPYQNNPAEYNLPYQSAPYRDPELAFIALKPTSNGDMRDVYSKLTAFSIEEMLLNRQNELVDLKLPKFEITFDKELNKSLYDIGLKMCFDPEKADFSRMGKTLGDGNLYISLVRQKARIIVDEEGTEAAAVTEIDMRDGCGISLEPPKELYFNEPFLYMIMDMERELPLFIGILDDPKEE